MLATLFSMDDKESMGILEDLRDAFFEFMRPVSNPGFWFTIKSKKNRIWYIEGTTLTNGGNS